MTTINRVNTEDTVELNFDELDIVAGGVDRDHSDSCLIGELIEWIIDLF